MMIISTAKKQLNKYLIKNHSAIKMVNRMKSYTSEDNIIIFSEARGGSTWLMEMIQSSVPVSINWEPLHPHTGIFKTSDQLGIIPYLKNNETSQYYFNTIKKSLELKTNNTVSLDMMNIKTAIKAKYVLTKFVRGNMLSFYILANFKFKYKPIYLLRHPIDIALSQIKTFNRPPDSTNYYRVPECKNNERYIKHAAFLKQFDTLLEKRVAHWCINNCPLIESIEKMDLCVVYYSDLLLKPKEEMSRIYKEIGLEEYCKNIDSINSTKPSITDFKNQLHSNTTKQLHKNINKLTKHEKENIQRIFDHFGLKIYNAYSPFVNK